MAHREVRPPIIVEPSRMLRALPNAPSPLIYEEPNLKRLSRTRLIGRFDSPKYSGTHRASRASIQQHDCRDTIATVVGRFLTDPYFYSEILGAAADVGSIEFSAVAAAAAKRSETP
jgi:hypothetical protein